MLLARRRANFMERAVDAMPVQSQSLLTAAHLTGMLSLLHVAYQMELRNFIDELPVSDAIGDAIPHSGGVLGNLLSATKLLECSEVGLAAAILERLAISPSSVRNIIEFY